LGLLAAVAWPFALAHFYFEELTWRAVVVAERTVARTGPSASQIENFSLQVGTVIHVLDESNAGWVKFSYAGGRKGFVERSRVEFL
jgi:uncharacterized protein YgiM (DUF1202 family)